MRWNWQLSDWPDFRFDAERIRASEEQFLKGSGVVIGALHHLDADERDGLTIELISQEVVDSSAIEGEILDRASVQSSLARHLGFAADQRRASAAEAGAAELMADVYRSHAAPLDDRTLFAWHAMLMNGRRDIADVGRYQTHEDAMQIVSGALHAPRVHFEAPASEAVPMEMSRFIAWFNDSAPSSPKPLPAITRAAISHL
jgi:Fic family protein